MGDEQLQRGPGEGSNDQNPQEGSSERAHRRGAHGDARRRIGDLGAAIGAELLDLAQTVVTLVFILLHVGMDLAFIAGWVYVHNWFEHDFLPKFSPFEGLDKVSLFVLKLVFSGLILYAVVVHISRDVANIWRRTWPHRTPGMQ